MRTLATLTTLSLLLCGAMAAQPANAQGPFRASLHLGATEVDRVIRSSGSWWSSVDERGNDYATVNACPPNASCTTVAIQEDKDFSAWHFVALQRFALNRECSSGIDYDVYRFNVGTRF